MRTKTMLLSALLGALGSVSVMAQSNVYSLNAVGYINVTNYPGLNMVSCPLITSPDNTVGTVFNNSNGALTGSVVFFYSPSTGYSYDTALPTTGKGSTTNANGWNSDGTNILSPGVCCWFENNSASTGSDVASNIVITFVGTVPTGPITNSLYTGLNLVSTVVPASGDIVTNSLMNLTNYNVGDTVYTYNQSVAGDYTTYQSGSGKGYSAGYNGNWTSVGDPILPWVGAGFFYQNNGSPTVQWVENYSVAQ
jgi:hypothetical protein